jgi:hypothetical protein
MLGRAGARTSVAARASGLEKAMKRTNFIAPHRFAEMML